MVSDPKACNNIVIKDQAIFEETDAFLEYGYSFQPTLPLTQFSVEGISRYLDQRSFRHQVGSCVSKLSAYLNDILSGTHHRRQRKLLNPVFNINHMRYMIPIFYGVVRQVLSEAYIRVAMLE